VGYSAWIQVGGQRDAKGLHEVTDLYFNGTRVFKTTPEGIIYFYPVRVGTMVPYIIGIPSVRAKVLGLVGDNYVLRQEYETQDERGKWIHVKKDYYREKDFIDGYWLDTARLSSHSHDTG
jgi:hypothetical protein